MITALQKSESDQTCRQELMKSLERLSKVSSDADIRLSIGNMVQKNGVDMAEKEGKREKKQMERNKREAEKEKKRFDMELQKEKLQSEKELKRLQDEAEKEEKRREKEESESRKQLKRKQEELEKDQRRREKEEAEQKKQLALQKQASLMERFLNKSKNSSPSQKDPSPAKMKSTDSSCKKSTVTLSMDWALSQFDETNTENIWKSHLNSWRHLGHSIRSNRKQHWGIRWMPKTELVKELKLTSSRQPHRDDELSLEKLVDEWDETDSDCRQCHTNADILLHTGPKCKRKKQLLQFDKSHRPAFYGNWPKKSQVIGPRHPFVKDPDLDYEIDSDEEWEEEEPGESLSDCDKDDEEESLEEGPSKAEDEENESEDGFFVPDGYLSENEGVQEDRMECESSVEARNSPSCKQVESEELCVFIRQQKHLHNLTERALRKNWPLIISNLMHEKVPLILTEDLIGTQEFEQTCLLALSMRVFPGCPSIEISVGDDVQEENLEASSSSCKGNTIPVATATAILDSDLPQIVSVIQSSTQGINKVVESLQIKFPTISKTQLRNKVREMSDFTDNRWQVKKDILDILGLSPSPEKSGVKMKNIAAFFSKRCLPPVRKAQNPNETSPQSSHKPDSDASELHTHR